jgi:hypothetical protein
MKNYFPNVATVSAGMTTTTCTWLTKQHVAIKHFESETTYKRIHIHIVIHLSLLKREKL